MRFIETLILFDNSIFQISFKVNDVIFYLFKNPNDTL